VAVVGAALAVALLPALLAASPAAAVPARPVDSAGNGAAAATAGSAAAAASASRASAGQAGGTSGPARVVSFHGYAIGVPASWPVYRLAGDASRCVLFNRHAVYLGTPGAGALFLNPCGWSNPAGPGRLHAVQLPRRAPAAAGRDRQLRAERRQHHVRDRR
jgi:hypothetical protein